MTREYDRGALTRKTSYEYATNAVLSGQTGLCPNGPWITNLLSRKRVYNGDDTLAGGIRYVYDDLSNDFESTPVRGDLVRVEEPCGSGGAWEPTQRLTHTLESGVWYGPTATSDALGHTTTYAYDEG